MKTFVVYHSECMDGMGACWAAWAKLGNKATYVPYAHDDFIPDFGTEPAKIYCLDIAFPIEQYDEIIKVHRVQIIDHHHSTMEVYRERNKNLMLQGKPTHIFDMNHSGAVLAWKFFHSNRVSGRVPKFLQYIEDRDLWRNKLPNTAAFTAAIMNKPKNISTYDKLARTDFPTLIKMGECVLEENQYMLENILKHHNIFVTLGGERIPMLNSNVLMSDVGDSLLKKYPDCKASAYFYIQNDGTVKIGLRSNGECDVSAIAIEFGGGGHKTAAAFIMPFTEFAEKFKNDF